ncbi:MAG TPA: 2Fe-2S iron-sulfur cluster-binding protein [Xanthobacteraceae bacterium]|jgi:toluene monooxygenase electron transfer component|nr:2Fe-2S iron-sulfur cluster-binding protein [Xanthobacteraceae bacterium]
MAGEKAAGEVRIDKSDVHFTCDAHDSITRAGLKAGYGMPYECNAGGCGTCRFELVSGEVEDLFPDAPAWSERDRKRGRRLSCQSRPKGDVVIKLRLEDMYKPRVAPLRQTFTLVETRPVTHDIREFKFRGETAQAFLPGQYALLNIPGVGALRAYSMSSIANTPQTDWDFQIRKTATGKATGILFDKLKPGDTVQIDGPYGHAYLREDSEREVICVAGGSGVSPMLSVVRGIAASPKMTGRTVHFFMGGRAPRDICGEDELSKLPGFGKTLHYHPAISEPGLETTGNWSGRFGLIHDVVAQMHGDRMTTFEWYFAGPPPMVNAVCDMLRLAGVPLEQQHFDRYY